ncbi:uncharacterized protein LOC114320303 isoform X2 [Camellia sinensis]|uniref:uncharacterized protein LOC114320303 isoform X2 n=1 Tax=Camellia sinensis TaxID=4442 RepID=UPI0010364A67|nr:uncharacterized protein LOC114320303 isoform X2 [Camellia sinensis]
MLVYRATSNLCKYGCSVVYPQQNQNQNQVGVGARIRVGGVNGSGMNNNSNIIMGSGGGGRIRPRCFTRAVSSSGSSRVKIGLVTTATGAAAAVAIMFWVVVGGTNTNAVEQIQAAETLSDIPQMLSGDCSSSPQDCKKAKIQRPKSRKAESCTIKCVTTCIRGGVGSPGEGPLNVRSLVECSDICNLIGDGDDGP